MAFTIPTSKLSYYHTFSKLPVEDTLPLGSAINKAGHTVSATEVWTAEIPYFGKMGSTADITSKVTPYAKTNDMVQITSGADKDKVFRRNEVDKTGKNFNDLWIDVTSEFVDGAKFKNANDDEVLIYHKSKKLELLNEGNNANITSKNNASRLWVGEGDNRRLVEQFVGVTDRSLNGLASVAYAPGIKKGTVDQVAGTHYYDYCVSGTILWATPNTTDSYITCFEYIGPKVSVSIENLQDALKTVQNTIENGVVSSISVSTDAENAGFEIDDSESTSPIINFTKGEVAKDSTALVTGGDVWNYITELHSVPQLRIVIVEEPADDWTKTEGLTIEKNTIYLVNDKASDPALSGSYIEYLAYAKKDGTIVTEQIGSTKIDLAEYAKDADVIKSIATANGVSGKVVNNVATITVQDGTTSQKGIVQLDNTIADNTSETTAATPKAVKEYAQKILTVNDGREMITENDLWGTSTTLSENGVLTITHNYISNPNSAMMTSWYPEITKVEDNKAYINDEIVANIQTSMIESGLSMFIDCTNLTSFRSNLHNLSNGFIMFSGCTNLASFSGDIPNLTNGYNMFTNCSNLGWFSTDMPNLTNGISMFSGCTNLASFRSDLSSLTNGSNMFAYCSELSSFSTDTNNIIMPNLMYGSGMFVGCKKLTSFLANLPSLREGGSMFSSCSELASFSGSLPNLSIGKTMFQNCKKLTSFSANLSSLINGEKMFNGCYELASFSSDLPKLTNGKYMFQNCNLLTSFSTDLSNLTDGTYMFGGCDNLESFNGDLSSLTNGNRMFEQCPKFESFNGDLSSLTNGNYMFNGCKLDTESVEIIADTINTVTNSALLHVDIGNTTPNEDEDKAFAIMKSKGWKVYVKGSLYTPTTQVSITTTDENGEVIETPIPFYAKPIEVTEEEAEYIGQDGKYYQILGGQFIYVNDPENYGTFTCLEDAAANMRLSKYEKPLEG